MTQPEKIIFIVNPIAGTRRKLDVKALIELYLDKTRFSHYAVVFTEYGGHAHVLAQQAVAEAYRYVIAVGGDGTVNEVASALVGSKAALGIIPLGSGNGLARHLKIPLHPAKAIKHLSTATTRTIDSCRLNERYFFCTAGVGFDAHIGNVFAKLPTRGFKSYVKATLSEFFGYCPAEYQLQTDTGLMARKAFVITFANAAQYGNNAYIAPEADIADGLLDVCVLHPFPRTLAFMMGMRLFRGNIHQSRFMEVFKTARLVVGERSNNSVHLDGEPCEIPGKLHVEVIPQSLHVVVGPYQPQLVGNRKL